MMSTAAHVRIREVAEAATTPAAAPEDRTRLLALDTFRGGAIAGVILATAVSSFPAAYAHLLHSPWEGLTVADLGLPFFLFIVGITTDFAVASRRTAGVPDGDIVLYALKRAALLFVIGILGAALPEFDVSTIRIPGVLQRIAVTYFVALLIALRTGVRGRTIASATLLIGYWLGMTLIPVPGSGATGMEALSRPDVTLAAWLDRTIFGAHLWAETGTWDPEGLLSTIPAVATVLLGTVAGAWLRQKNPIIERCAGLMAMGVLVAVLGMAWSWSFPVIKGIWTSSFTLVTAGLAALLLGTCLWLIDIRRVRGWTAPFVAFGVNPLTAYVGAVVVHGVLSGVTIMVGGARVSLREAIYGELFASWMEPRAASLAYGLAYVLLWLGIVWWLYRRGVRLRV